MTWLDDATITTAADKAAQVKQSRINVLALERDAQLEAVEYDLGGGETMPARPRDLENLKLYKNGPLGWRRGKGKKSVILTPADVNAIESYAKTEHQRIWGEFTAAEDAILDE